ncbi:MAG: DUF3352 domain-containing protein [Frankia sp.]|nr:DUF3352 domain-containing protein [Frankia sp.]
MLAETDQIVDAAVTQSDKHTLGDNKTYRDDVDKLHGDQVVLGWVDASRAYRVAAAAVPGFAPFAAAFSKAANGRVVVGAHAGDGYVELEGLSLGADTKSITPAKPQLFGDLPADTVAAVTVNNLGGAVNQAIAGAGVLGGIPGLPFSPQQLLQEFEQQFGISLQADLLPLLRHESVLSLGSVPGLAEPKVGLVTKVDDAAKAKSVAAKLAAVAAQADLTLESDVRTNTLFLTTGTGYLGTLTAQRGLSANRNFVTAMGDLGDSIGLALYVDLGQLLVLAQDQESYRDLRALKALGISVGLDGGRGYFRMRVVAG